jgi:hypothetical protein
MSAAQHTPGPWAISPEKCHYGDIATVYNTTEGWVSIHAPSWVNIGDQKVAMANARLISAAPDLLEALKGVLRVADRATVEFDAASAAIAKATGGEA